MPNERRYKAALPDLAYWSDMVKCRTGCPVNTDARGYVRAIAEGRFEEASRITALPLLKRPASLFFRCIISGCGFV